LCALGYRTYVALGKAFFVEPLSDSDIIIIIKPISLRCTLK